MAIDNWRQLAASQDKQISPDNTNPTPPGVAGGIKADNAVVKSTLDNLNNNPQSENNFTNNFIDSTLGFVNDVVEDPTSLLQGVATYAGGVVNGVGESISDIYENAADTVGSLFGNDPEDTVLPDDLENYTLNDAGEVIPLPDTNFNEDDLGANIFGNITGNYLQDTQQKTDKWEDWRVKLTLAEGSDYLYKAPNPGILKPLAKSQGLIFPYTPTINVQHQANYENYDLTHSNYRGYFYRGSTVQNVMVNATFTAQDTNEANYMLAALHFLKSCTKMFYGQDFNRGMPPPVVFLSGLGEYQYNNHPCVITTVNYNMPNDVDYIPAGVPDSVDPTSGFTQSLEEYSGHVSWSARIGRMIGAGLDPQSGFTTPPLASQLNSNTNPLSTVDLAKVYEGKTYVPTKIDINFIMLPIQTREQVSSKFSLQKYATGELIKKGFW